MKKIIAMVNNNKPKFITFEGCEGSGKSTQSKLLYEYLLSKNIKAIHTREVGGTLEAEKIRDLLVHSELMSVSELMLVMAARYEHINKVIIPYLLEGAWVICDRYVDSSACYQTNGSDHSMEDIFQLHHKLMSINQDNQLHMQRLNIPKSQMHGLMPDLTFFMDMPPAKSIARAMQRGIKDTNKFELKDITFHNTIYERFKFIAKTYSDRICCVKCDDMSLEEVHKIIVDKIFN